MADPIHIELIVDDKGTVKIKQFGQSVQKAGKQGEQSMKRMGKESEKLGATFKKLAGLAAGVFAVGKIKQAITESLRYADAIGKTADKLGLATSTLQEYRFAASQSGVETKTLDMAMQRFTRRVGEAVQGKGELKDTLIQYGIAVKDASGKTRDINSVLYDLADVIQGTESDSERLRIAFKAFDSEGAALVNMLRGGSDALKSFQKQANDLGIILDEKMIRNAEKANDALDIMNRVLKIQLVEAITTLAPEITWLAGEIVKLVGHFKDLARWAKEGFDVGDTFERNIKSLESQIRANEDALRKMTENPSMWDKIIYFGNTKEELRAKIADLKAELATNLKSYDNYIRETDTLAGKAKVAPVREVLAGPPGAGGPSAVEQFAAGVEARRRLVEWGTPEEEKKDTKGRDRALKRLQKWGEDSRRQSEKNAKGMADQYETFFFDVLSSRFDSLSDLGRSILDSLAQQGMRVLAQFAGQAVTGIMGNIGGGSGGGGLAGVFASMFHGGGRVGASAVPVRIVDPSIFKNAPRLHDGLRADEYPAILQRGEEVRKKGGGRAMSGVNVTFNIQTPDVRSFKASEGQLMTRAAMAMRRAQRNL